MFFPGKKKKKSETIKQSEFYVFGVFLCVCLLGFVDLGFFGLFGGFFYFFVHLFYVKRQILPDVTLNAKRLRTVLVTAANSYSL